MNNPVSIDACDGRVQLELAKWLSKTTPRFARESRKGVVGLS